MAAVSHILWLMYFTKQNNKWNGNVLKLYLSEKHEGLYYQNTMHFKENLAKPFSILNHQYSKFIIKTDNAMTIFTCYFDDILEKRNVMSVWTVYLVAYAVILICFSHSMIMLELIYCLINALNILIFFTYVLA